MEVMGWRRPFAVPPITVDAICIEALGGLAGPTLPVVRITAQ